MSTFHDLCKAVVSSGQWPVQGGSFSWGDEQVELCAQGRPTAGGATSWRAFGTSHHLTVVVDRLAKIGEP